MFQLEKYHGTKSRHLCPLCNNPNSFVRYVDENGEYLSSDVGRCNRESKCGYHKKPKEYFAENTNASNLRSVGTYRARQVFRSADFASLRITFRQTKTPSFDFIAPEHLKATISNYDRNNFVQFLFDLFPDCLEEINSVFRMYLVGTFDDYTCFPSIDRSNRVCRAKLIRFNPATGKRLKGEYDTSSLVRKLKLKKDFQYKQIFFGEHLLPIYPDKSVAIVEAEKTAIIASLCFPEFLWLGSNSKTWLSVERLQRLKNRKIILYPDADGFNLWQRIATDAQRQGLTVKISTLIEDHTTEEQKQNGFDLADYLIDQQREINRANDFVYRYNAKLKTVLKDEKLIRDFEMILDEQKAVAVINGDLAEAEAEALCAHPSNVRSVVFSL